MNTIAKFAKRASKWNELRYEQKFDLNLTATMIKEEVQEYKDAKDLVEQVDALCDICFIAAGALWKLNAKFDNETFNSFYSFYLLADIDYTDTLANIFDVMANYLGYYVYACSLHQILASSFDMLAYKMASQENAIEALFCIADSNDTKAVTKIATNAKYSEEGKGSEYVAPTAALTQLIAGIANEVKH